MESEDHPLSIRLRQTTSLQRRGITADTALRLARYFGTSHEFWMNLQVHYDVQVAMQAKAA
ncbi:MAG: HigA family addiction module antidote protein [Methylobacillus sp.]|nr:HigA family addiction module antidote protein [Methylobacillus sp.]